MMLGNPLLLGDDGYQISRSVRLRSADSAYFSRTPASTTSQTTWTWSGWVKRGALTNGFLFGAFKPSVGGYTLFLFSGDALQTYQYNDGSGVMWNKISTQVLRDPSAWYHLVLTHDSTNATAGDRVRLYVNGSRITSFSTSTDPSASLTSWVNTTNRHTIGTNTTSLTDSFFDGYLTEINFIDGQALTPSSFGQNDPVTGVWQPKKYAGTYGTNGFYLNFKDPSSTTTIGYDYSGNDNNWTSSGVSVTAGTTYDSMIDVPTMYADGGMGRGNYAVFNAINAYGAAPLDGNLKLAGPSNSTLAIATTSIAPPSTGKYYFETVVETNRNPIGVRLCVTSDPSWSVKYPGNTVPTNTMNYGFEYNSANLLLWSGGSSSSTAFAGALNVGDIVQLAIDFGAGQLWVGKNNTWYNSGNPATGSTPSATFTGGSMLQMYGSVVWVTPATVCTASYNFGQRPFAYTPPAGFKSLNTFNLPDSTIKAGNKYFDALTYTGNGATRSITGAQFQPDFVWEKRRSGVASSHVLVDSVRGAGTGMLRALFTQVTDAEESTTSSSQSAYGVITSLNSDGFSVASGGASIVGVNGSGESHVAWLWKAGGTAVTNNAGSISSQVSANTTAGFSIVTYTGTGANATVGHGLGVAPKMIIQKNRSASATNWVAGHQGLSATPWNSCLRLNTTDSIITTITAWNNTAPTSSVFSLGTDGGMNGNGTLCVAYCFAEVDGYSKFGSYTGNGSADGPFVYCGFRPRYILIKRTDAGTNYWSITDTARDTYNTTIRSIYPNDPQAESTVNFNLDILSNGFKARSGSSDINVSGATYIFAAFAENPFKYSLAR